MGTVFFVTPTPSALLIEQNTRVGAADPAGVVSTHHLDPRPEEPTIRCLFVTWNDDRPASQFSVPDDYTLDHLTGLPDQLAVFENGSELYLDLEQIRSAYCVEIAPDQRVVELPGL